MYVMLAVLRSSIHYTLQLLIHSSDICSSVFLQLLTPVVEGILQKDMERFAQYAKEL